MKLKVEWCENKNQDWKVATLKAPDDYVTENVSINRQNKKGEVFPNFDGIIPGADIEGELWKSDSGKWYLFAPKPQNSHSGGGNRMGMMKEVIKEKQEGIRASQENKELGIKISSTMNKAIDLAIAEGKPEAERILHWRKWMWENWEVKDTDFNPF